MKSMSNTGIQIVPVSAKHRLKGWEIYAKYNVI
jgi:hypothetical protein